MRLLASTPAASAEAATPGSTSRALRAASPEPSDARTVRVLHAEDRQGDLSFHLQRINGGLYVERTEQHRRGLRTSQSLLFVDAASLRRWCDDDPVRFTHPLLHAQLCRDADSMWSLDDEAALRVDGQA